MKRPDPPPPDDTHRWMYFEGGAPVDCQYWWCSRCGMFCEQPVGANAGDGPRFWSLDMDKEPGPGNECPECSEAVYSPLDSDRYIYGLAPLQPDEVEVEVRVVKRRYSVNERWSAFIAWPFCLTSLTVSEPTDSRDAAKKALAVLVRNIERLNDARKRLKQVINEGLV